MISRWQTQLQFQLMRPFLQQSPSRISRSSSPFALQCLSFFSSEPSSLSVFASFTALLQGRVSRPHLLQVHAKVYRANAHQDNLIATRLIGHYRSDSALRVFNQLQNPNIFPFNGLIRVLAENRHFSHSFLIFKSLKERSLSPNDLTFSFLFKACLRSNNARYLMQIHTQILKSGYLCDSSVCSGLLVMYAKGFRDLASAFKVFDDLPEKSEVHCWTSLIAGCAQSGQADEVLRLFNMMLGQNLRPEDDTMVSVLSACSNLEIIQIEKWIDLLSKFISDTDVDRSKVSGIDSVNTVLVYLYGKWGMIEKSRERFDEIDNIAKRSVLPWNAMIGAYVQNGCPLEALDLFRSMVKEPTHRPNHVTMVSVLSACGQVGDVELGRWAHEHMKSQGRKGVLENNTILGTALIDMYSKCGSLEMAKEVYESMVSKDVISFNAIIMGLATNGKGEEAISFLSKMQELGLHPNHGTFLSLLCACSHSGLAKEGRWIFKEMTSHFSMAPKQEHYACYVDLLARAGFIDEALEEVMSMACKPNNFVWGSLLGGCLLHSRLDIAEKVYNRLIEVDPENSGGYVMLANAFAVDCQWRVVSRLRWVMKEKGVKKQPGKSWISVNGVVHEFLAYFPSHPQIEGIYQTLRGLVNVMKVASS